MDKQFIESMVDAYFLDNRIFESGEVTKKYYTDLILNTMRELRETDIELYNEAYDCSRLSQNRIITNFLDLNFKTDDLTEEELEEVISTGINSIINTINPGAISGGASSIISSINGIFSGASAGMSSFFGAFSKLVTSGVSTMYSFGVPIAVMIGIILILLHQGKLSNSVFNAISNIAKIWQTAFKWLSKRGSGVQLRYAIIQKNTEECYRFCVVDPRTTNLSHYSGVSKTEPWWGILANVSDSKKGKCLRECFIDNLIGSINLLMQEYFTCLQKSNVDITNAEDDVMKFISRLSNSNFCEQYYKYAKDTFETFDKALDYVYVNTSDDKNEKQLKIQNLRQKLYKTRIFVQNSYKNKPFDKNINGGVKDGSRTNYNR